jgi:hypothetical protein
MRRARALAVGAAILVPALAIRILPIAAAKPYIAYVDEGNFLHPAARLLKSGGWDPGSYLYPQFPTTAALVAARVYARLCRTLRGREPWRTPRRPPEIYDELEPYALLLIARGIDVALGMAIVVAAALFAARLGGVRAGLWAGLFAGFCPALVLRAPIATVDSWAALFVLACLILTDRGRSSRCPGVVSLLAGVAAGFAFASKYPAALVLTAFAATTTLEELPGTERLRRLALAIAGLAAGATLAMPALVRHAGAVRDAVRTQAILYSRLESPPLWRQAFLRAEWDLPYERAEIGLALVLLSALGLADGCRDRRLAPTFRGWAVWMGVCLALYGRQSFQPFRNLLPLVPVACVAAAVGASRAEKWFRRPGLPRALVAGWVVAFCAVPLGIHAWKRRELADSRVEAVDWLARRLAGPDRVAVVRELGVLERELDRLGGRAEVFRLPELSAVLAEERPRFVVGGVLNRPDGPPVEVAEEPWLRSSYARRARFGEEATACDDAWWRGNREIIDVLERRQADGGADDQAAEEEAFTRIWRRDSTASESTKSVR